MAEAHSTGAAIIHQFSVSAFARGLAVAGVLYAALIAWLFFSDDHVQELQLQRLASQTVIVDWQAAVKKPAAPQQHSQQEATLDSHSEKLPTENGQDVPGVPQPEGALPQAPVPGLFESTSLGPMPKIGNEDDLTYFKAYKRPFDAYISDLPMVSIVITGIGLSDVATDSALSNMPPEVSLVMSPYTLGLDLWINEARAHGHEIWFTLPMESEDYPQDDPGPHTMLIGAPERENLAKLDWLMSRAHGYVGFVTSYQPSFMTATNDMRPVVGSVYSHGLAFVDGSARPGMIPQTMALGMKAPYSTVDLWIDQADSSPAAIAAALDQLEAIAKEKGYAVGVIQTLPVSYQQVLDWVAKFPQKGLRLAPLSATTGR